MNEMMVSHCIADLLMSGKMKEMIVSHCVVRSCGPVNELVDGVARQCALGAVRNMCLDVLQLLRHLLGSRERERERERER